MRNTSGRTAMVAVLATLILPAAGLSANTFMFGTQEAQTFLKGFNSKVGETKKKLPMQVDEVTMWVDYHAEARSKTIFADYEVTGDFSDLDSSKIAVFRDHLQEAICQQDAKSIKNWNDMVGFGWKMTSTYRQSGKTVIAIDLNSRCTGTGV